MTQPPYHLAPTRPRASLLVRAAAGLLAATTTALMAIVPAAGPAAADATLNKTGVVPRTGSTTTAGPGDTIDWVVSSTNPTTGRVQATITDPIQGAGTAQTYVAGSLEAPPGFTKQWSTDGGGTFTATDQGAATNVVQAQNPNFESPPTATGALLPKPLGAIATPTGGDGYVPILYTTAAGVPQVWNVFHHTGPGAGAPQMVCTDRLTGSPCAGWAAGQARYLSSTPGPYGSGPADIITPTPVKEALDPINPAIRYISVESTTSPASVGNLCLNLESQSTCGYTPLSTNSADLGAAPFFQTTEAVLAGNQVLTYSAGGQMTCYDIPTRAACSGQPYPFEGGPGSILSPAIGTNIYGVARGNSLDAFCFDASTHAPCAGWNPSKVIYPASSGYGDNPVKFATYDASGTPNGVCLGLSRVDFTLPMGCFDLAGKAAATPPGLQIANPALQSAGFIEMLEVMEITAQNGHAESLMPLVQNRTTFGDGRTGGTLCYDWTTTSPCSAFPSDSGIPGYAFHANVNGGVTQDYGYAYDGQCVFGLGNAGWLFTLDAVTGTSPCSKTTATLTLNPPAYYCDGKAGHVQSYEGVTLRDIDLSSVDFTRSSVTVKDANGNTLGTFPFDPATGKADISSVPVGTAPITATLDVALNNASSFTATNHPRAVLSFVGDAPQMCFQTTVATNCMVSSVSNQATSAYTDQNGVITDATSPKVTFAVTGASSTATATHGSSYGVDVAAVGLHPINQLGKVATADPGGPSHAAKRIVSASLPGIVSLGVITTGSDSAVTPTPSTSTSTAEIANVNLLGGAITASAVKAVSQTAASPEAASTSSAGSTFTDLRINGQSLVNVAPNTTVEVKNPLIPSQVIASAHLYEETTSRSVANGQANATDSVNMIRVVLLKPFLILPAGAEIVISHAQSDVVTPACSSAAVSVSGEAFTAFAQGTLGGQQVTATKVGDALLPSAGGAASNGTAANLPGVVTSVTAANTTSGSLQPNPNSTSRSVTQGVNVLNGLVTADVLDVASTSSADGTHAGTTFAVTFTNLKVGGIAVDPTVPPNTTISVPTGGGLLRVVLNEQVVNTNGTSDTEGTVNAIHAYLFNGVGVFTGEVIVASAHSDAHV